ncbi:serine/threonine-protein phosphatase 5 [Pyxicephalus adspersus]|uniref:serine/threonine-protein phosphatase 5 n=1 Tax=Pyxicephalus adspersus TaxID=30357 RepID=UPI003B5AC3AB
MAAGTGGGESGGGGGRTAEELKEKANEYFRVKDYDRAVQYYTEAITLDPNNAIYYGNRSLAYLRTECYGYALADASRAIQLDAKYIKGYYRRAASNMALGKLKAALKDYETVVKVRPNDKDAQMKFQECSKLVRQKAFERAIACDQHNRSVVDSLDIEGMSDHHSTTPLCLPYPSPTPLCLISQHSLIFGGFPEFLQIFNGDFVDRGSFSVEVIVTLCGFKLLYPAHFHLLRGNHETDTMNQMYGFEGEVKAKYSTQMFQLFSEVFQWLPLAMCVNQRVLVSPLDQMGNKGAYIHLNGSDLKPKFHQFEAVPHPNVKPMMYANSLLQMGMM